MSSIEIAENSFKRIREANPQLVMEVESSTKGIELEMNVRKQPGLDFDVLLDLQNRDELHLHITPFWGEWFSSTDPVRVKEYESAVNGMLSGLYRLKVINRRGNAVKAILQAPSNSSWRSVFTWSKIHLPIGRKTITYVQNTQNT
jgi:hypothetical protein